MERTLGNKIKSARIESGLTQIQLAQKLGVSPSAIGMYEQGRREPNYSSIFKICRALNISIYDIAPEDHIFSIDTIMSYVIKCLSTEKAVTWNGKVLDMEKKHSMANMLRLLTNEC